MRRAKIDLYFAPHFNVPFRCPVPFVATIHDLILHTYARGSWIRKFCYARMVQATVRKSSALIAVSRFTKSEIGRLYGESTLRKVSVIPEGVSSDLRRLSADETVTRLAALGIEPGYLLYVGNGKAHKNIPMLIAAHRLACNVPPLVLVSDPAVRAMLLPGDRITVLGDIPDNLLPALYSGARCFITASLSEGFCLPIVEARACGCPVIATDTTAIPEVAGPHTLLVAPVGDSLKAAMEHPPTVADPLGHSFQWPAACQATAAILRHTLSL